MAALKYRKTVRALICDCLKTSRSEFMNTPHVELSLVLWWTETQTMTHIQALSGK